MSLRVLEEIRDELRGCAAVDSTAEFCRCWLAKDESYLRVLRHHGSCPSADAFATCASKLSYYAKHLQNSDDPKHKEWAELFQRLRALCVVTMEAQAKAKWMTARRMGV